MNLRTTILLPTLNEADKLGETLLGLRRFDEIVVVDGNSDDPTVEIAHDHGVRVVISDPGRAKQMNAGAYTAVGEILVFLHADTILPVDAADLIGAAARQPGFVWGRFDVRITGDSRWLPVVATMMNARSCLTGVATGDQAMFMTRHAFMQVGGFPDIPIMEDIALSKSLRRLARPVCIRSPVITSGRRWDMNGAVRTIATMWAMRFGYWIGVSPQRLSRLYARLRRG